MDNKNLNNKLINILVFISLIIIICMGITFVIAWKKTNDLIFIISGPIGILGVLFNIYLLSRAKSKK
jgi:predicted membrane chloride channel (bestrophin family)